MAMEVLIKTEENKSFCSTCLAVECQMFQLGSLLDIYQIILNCQISSNSMNQILLCVQCFNFLTSVKEFQCRAQRAQNVLNGSQKNTGSYSGIPTLIGRSKNIEILIPKDELDVDNIKNNLDDNILLPHKKENEWQEQIKKESKVTVELEIKDNILNVNKSKIHEKNSLSPVNIVNIKDHTIEEYENFDEDCPIDNAISDLDNKNNILEIFNKDKDKKRMYKEKWKRNQKRHNKKPKFKLTKEIDIIFYKNIDVNESKTKSNNVTDENIQTDSTNNLLINNRSSYICKVCKVVCAGDEREAHVQNKRIHKEIFQCITCNLLFDRRREFFVHYKYWHMQYICDHCGIRFSLKDSMSRHMRKKHLSVTCKVCFKTFPKFRSLYLHNKVRHSQAHAVPAYCVECDTRYPDHYHYQRHLATSVKHNPKEKKRVPCPDCNKIFSRKIKMTQHRNVVHLKSCMFRCGLCDKNFQTKSCLKRHTREVHEGIPAPKNRFCDICGRGFSTNRILRNHLRTHTGERPYACVACPARFTQETALKTHQRALHADDTRASLKERRNKS